MTSDTKNMESLSERDEVLVAIGASLGSNCIPCMIYHIKTAKNLGLSEPQIRQALQVAELTRSAPARQVMQTALAQLDSEPPEEKIGCAAEKCCC